MKVIKQEQFFTDTKLRNKVLGSIKKGAIVIYPTDTIYGIGCDVGNKRSVRKIYEAKQRGTGVPFSIIVPSVEWIEKHLVVPKGKKAVLQRSLPGRYTLIFKAKGHIPEMAVSKEGTVGVRIPEGQFSDIIREAGILLVTTSVNVHGSKPAASISEVPKSIAGIVDVAIDAGPLTSRPSTILDMTAGEPKVIRK